MSGIIMIKTMMGLGVLSIPSVFDTLGLIPGIICLIAIALITTWASIQIQHFKINHPSIYGVDDAGQMMVGRIGREILYAAFIVGRSAPRPHVLRAYTRSMDHGSGLRPDQYLDSFERRLDTWHLQCGVHGCGSNLHISPRQYQNSEQDLLACLDRDR
jgi:hypothetical protein